MPFVFKEPEASQQFWANNAVKGKKGFQPTGGEEKPGIEDAQKRVEAKVAGYANPPWDAYEEHLPKSGKPDGFERVEKFGGGNDTAFVAFDANGKPAAVTTLFVQKGQVLEVSAVVTKPGLTGKGHATRLYDHIQDETELNLYEGVGRTRMSESGKGFVLKWLEHRAGQQQSYSEPRTFTDAGDPDWRTVQRIAESQELLLAKALEVTFAAASFGIDEEKMAFELAAHGNTGEIDWAELSKQLSDALEASIRTVATQTALALLPRFRDEHSEKFADPYETMSLVLRHSAAEDYLRKHLPTLVTNVTRETQEAIRDVILDGFQGGIPPIDMARMIRPMIGLTRPQAATHQRLFSQLVAQMNRAGGGSLIRRPGSGVGTLNRISAQLARYDAKAIRYRAFNIARTETLRASNAGQQALWTAATNEGLLERGVTKREWIATPSERTCPYCMKLDGIKVGMEEAWQSELGDVTTPPLHPSCRCAMGIAIDASEIPKAKPLGSGEAPLTPLTDPSLLPTGGLNLPKPLRTGQEVPGEGQWLQTPTGGVADSISSFTHNGDQYIRAILRGEQVGSMQERAAQWAATLVEHLEKSGTIKAGSLYRGIKLSSAQIAEVQAMRPGTPIDMNLSSWTASPTQARAYAAAGIGSGERQAILQVKGAKAINAGKYSGFAEEKEWITNGRFKFNSATFDRQGRLIVELTQERVWSLSKVAEPPRRTPTEQLTRLKILEDPDFVASRKALAAAKADWKAAPNDSDEKRAANKRINLAAIAMEDATNAARARIAREVEATNPEEAKALVRLLREEVTTLRAEYMRSTSKAMLESDLSIRRDTARDLLERLSAKLPLAERIEPRPVLDTKDPRWRLNPQSLAIEQRVYDNFLKISQAIEAEFGVRSRWSGAAHLGTLEPNAAATFTWENAVSITAKTAAMSERDYLKVLMHEAFHSAQPLRPMEYMGKRGWEEGVVEMATQTFEASIRRRAGLPTGAGYNTYAQYTNALESIRSAVGKSKEEFYGALIRVPSPDREALVKQWIDELVPPTQPGKVPAPWFKTARDNAKRTLDLANKVLND